MKVLIPFSYYYPENCAGLFVVDDLMHRLAAEGIETTLYVPTPTRNVAPDAAWKRSEMLCDGRIRIRRFRMFGEGRNPVLRAFRYTLCECVYLYRLLTDDYDVAFIDSTPPIQGLKLPIVRLFRKKAFVYNVQDLFPDTLSGTGLASEGGLLWKIGSWVARVTFRNSDRIIAISQDIARNLRAKGVPPEKIEVVYNWVDEKAVKPVAKEENPLFEEFGLQRDRFTVVYAGNLGNAQNIRIIADAAAALREDDRIRFVVFGSGGFENELRERIAREELSNLTLLPLQPRERVPFVYGLGDACIVSCKAGLGGSAMPSKTWSILSCGRPVVANFDEGELKTILETNDCGLFTRAGDLNAFAAAIRTLANDPERCADMGRAGRRFIERNLTREAGTSRYAKILKEAAAANIRRISGK